MIFVALGIVLSRAPLAQDDFGFLMWAQLTRDQPLSMFAGPDWTSYHRPLAWALWWLSGQVSIDGELLRWVEVALWAACGTLLTRLARPAAAPTLLAVLLLGTNQIFLDLLQWRSWITTVGALTGLAATVHAIGRRAPPLVTGLLSLLTLGFKEVGAVGAALVAFSNRSYRWVALVTLVCVAVAAAASVDKLGAGHLVPNVSFQLRTFAYFAPAVPLLLPIAFPRWGALRIAWTLVLAVAPSPVQALAFLGAALACMWNTPFLWPALVAWAIPLGGNHQARQYMLEGWLLAAAAGLSQARSRPHWVAVLCCLCIAAPSVIDFHRARQDASLRFAAQRDFIGQFHPEPARELYHPDPNWSWDVDAIYWVRHGASLNGVPPPNTQPVQVGPISGVWADLQPTR